MYMLKVLPTFTKQLPYLQEKRQTKNYSLAQ